MVEPTDESLDHPSTDHINWTEKVCAMAALADGSIGIGFGMGKYVNRNVIDAYAGVSIGKQQWNVRASRHLTDESTVVGPITYDVIEPLGVVRFALAANDVLPISFEWIFRAAVPCVMEEESRFERGLKRYHQIGTPSGWVEVDGVRTELTVANSVSTRDHSWGERRMVGKPETETPHMANVTTAVIWSPILMWRADGTHYGIHTFYQRHAVGDWEKAELMGGTEYRDGRREAWASLVPVLDVDDANRRVRGGTLNFTMGDGSARPITVTALGDTGFHLGGGLYFGLDDHWHGEDRGPLHVDGEHIADCTTVESAHRLHQIRDNLVRFEDPVGGGVGVGNMQTIISGPHPEWGLTEEASFM